MTSITTTLSDDTDRRLTASAGYDSCVQFHWPSASWTKPSSPSRPSTAVQILLAEALVGLERQLEGRALDVIEQDLQVVRVDERVLRRGAEEVVGVPDHELIERRARRHQHRRGSAGAAAGAAGPLPRRGDRARIAGHDRRVERADVDAELERAGRHDRPHAALAQAALDLAPAQRQVAAAIAAHHLRRARRALAMHARRDDGSAITFQAIARLDTPVEVEYYRNGGILQTVLRKLIAS